MEWDEGLGEKAKLLFFPYVQGQVIQIEKAEKREHDFLTVKLDRPIRFEGAEPEEVLRLPRWIWRRVETKEITLKETIKSTDIPPNPCVPLEKLSDKDEALLKAKIYEHFM